MNFNRLQKNVFNPETAVGVPIQSVPAKSWKLNFQPELRAEQVCIVNRMANSNMYSYIVNHPLETQYCHPYHLAIQYYHPFHSAIWYKIFKGWG